MHNFFLELLILLPQVEVEVTFGDNNDYMMEEFGKIMIHGEDLLCLRIITTHARMHARTHTSIGCLSTEAVYGSSIAPFLAGKEKMLHMDMEPWALHAISNSSPAVTASGCWFHLFPFRHGGKFGVFWRYACYRSRWEKRDFSFFLPIIFFVWPCDTHMRSVMAAFGQAMHHLWLRLPKMMSTLPRWPSNAWLRCEVRRKATIT